MSEMCYTIEEWGELFIAIVSPSLVSAISWFFVFFALGLAFRYGDYLMDFLLDKYYEKKHGNNSF